MKTTLEIRDDLLRRAKALALARGMTLKELFSEALEERVRRGASREKPAWRKLSGQLRSLHAETRKIQARVDAEFEQIDDEDKA
ncbi:MAG: type II toxin-antitoxin system VapB family antitoxin [Myxococcales bacterium]|nr:type II toxin-antitoxin system VapB family antitoxin [Myxococcales bacterium]